MTATSKTTPAQAASTLLASNAWTGTLPETDAKKPQQRYVTWHSLIGMGVQAGGHPTLGVMELVVVLSKNRSCVCRYVVTELPCGWPGRAFRCSKARGEEGSDSEAETYDVFAGNNPGDSRCECKGWLHHSHCKHLEAIQMLLAAGQLTTAESPVNPEADTGPTETPEWCF